MGRNELSSSCFLSEKMSSKVSTSHAYITRREQKELSRGLKFNEYDKKVGESWRQHYKQGYRSKRDSLSMTEATSFH